MCENQDYRLVYGSDSWGIAVRQVPKIIELEAKLLVGISMEMSRMADRTPDLWRSFMPRRSEVKARSSTDYMSMQVYPGGADQVADPSALFTKWAVGEVVVRDTMPAGMSPYDLAGGLYAMFVHNGPATDLSTFASIFTDWLPNSDFVLDDREHFEVLPADYKPMDPNAREEIWIPVRPLV